MEQEREIVLLQQAAEIQKNIKSEEASIEEAKTKIPDLAAKINSLIESKAPPEEKIPANNSEPPGILEIVQHEKTIKARRSRMKDEPTSFDLRKFQQEIFDRMRKDNEIVNLLFNVPFEEEKLRVVITNGERRGTLHSIYNQSWRRLQIDIEPLDFLLNIYGKNAVIESKLHNHKPFDMHTPIGPGHSSDLGPIWRRDMNMADFQSYDALIDRLSQPDVACQRTVI